MELNINSPKYYKDVYGVDDEIYSCLLYTSDAADEL